MTKKAKNKKSASPLHNLLLAHAVIGTVYLLERLLFTYLDVNLYVNAKQISSYGDYTPRYLFIAAVALVVIGAWCLVVQGAQRANWLLWTVLVLSLAPVAIILFEFSGIVADSNVLWVLPWILALTAVGSGAAAWMERKR